MVRGINPNAVSGLSYADMDSNTRAQIQCVIDKCTHTIASLLFLSDNTGFNRAVVEGDELRRDVTCLMVGYLACRRGSMEGRVLHTVMGSFIPDRAIDDVWSAREARCGTTSENA